MNIIDVPSAQTFLRLNAQLQNVSLAGSHIDFAIDRLLMYLPNIHTMSVFSDYKEYDLVDVTCFQRMERLKSMEFTAVFSLKNLKRIFNALISGQVQLERLDLRGLSADSELIDLICRHLLEIRWLQTNSN